MTELEMKIIEKAKSLLNSGEVNRVIGWKKGEFYHDPSPATFESVESLSEFVYNDFCGANLSKYLIEISKKEGKTAVFMKACDTYSFNQLLKEHRIKRENVLVVGIECNGKLDPAKLDKLGIDGVTEVEYVGDEVIFKTIFGEVKDKKQDVILEKCMACQGSKGYAVSDDKVIINEPTKPDADIFALVA